MITGRALRRLLLPPGELGHASPELDPLGHTAPRQVLVIASNPRTPVYDVEAIEGALAHLQAGREYWSSYFARNGIEPLELTYEGLVADRESSVRSVLQLVGVEVEAIPPAPVERQASAINAEWIARFTQDRPHLARGARGAAP